jgi:hypothetical protein
VVEKCLHGVIQKENISIFEVEAIKESTSAPRENARHRVLAIGSVEVFTAMYEDSWVGHADLTVSSSALIYAYNKALREAFV